MTFLTLLVSFVSTKSIQVPGSVLKFVGSSTTLLMFSFYKRCLNKLFPATNIFTLKSPSRNNFISVSIALSMSLSNLSQKSDPELGGLYIIPTTHF